MPEVTSRSPKQNRSSTSSSTQRSLAPCWASYCPSLALRSDPSTFTDLHLLATFHPRISVHSLTFEAFCSRTIAGSSHNIEEKKNWDTPSLASSSLTQKAAVPQFLSCCDSHPKDCGLTYAAACQPAAFDTQPGWRKEQEVTLQPRRMSSLQDSEAEAAHTRSSRCCSLHAGNHGIPSPRGKWNEEWDRQTRSAWWFALLIKWRKENCMRQ